MTCNQLGGAFSKYPLLVLLCCSSLFVFSQTTQLDSLEIDGVMHKAHYNDKWTFIVKSPDDTIYIIPETLPEFPGGNKAMMEFLGKTVKYPPAAKANGIQGKVIVNFEVAKSGAIEDVKIRESVHPILDEEALRVIRAMPIWKPGTQKEKKVRVSFNLPISFWLVGTVTHNLYLYHGKASKYLEEGDNKNAILYYSKAIKLRKNDAADYYNRGIAYHKDGNIKKATKDLKKASGMGHKKAKEYLETIQ